MRDLMIVEEINRKLADRLPVTFNYAGQGGYFNMPSARMVEEGDFGFGYASVPPYKTFSGRFQLTPNLELTGTYRVFNGIPDPVLSPYGYGDYTDRGVNIRLSLLRPEDTGYLLPGIAVGWDDFTGTKAFQSRYFVLTKIWPTLDLETSLGFGEWRLKGAFGGALWMPWRHSCFPYLQPLALVAEYDAIDYRNPQCERHPKGRQLSSRINFGLKYQLGPFCELSAAWIRGKKLAFSISGHYNLGTTQGLLPKVDNPLPYCSSLESLPLDEYQPHYRFAQELAKEMRRRGFELLSAKLYDADSGRSLRLVIDNLRYYWEYEVREQLQGLLSTFLPPDIENIYVEIFEQGCSVQEYRFCGDFLEMLREREIGDYEFSILFPLREVSCIPGYPEILWNCRHNWFCPSLLPKTQFFFGSSTGKFKYAVGLSAGVDGYLPYDLYYRISTGYFIFSSLPSTNSYDRLNPSQLPNVNTDLICYLHRGRLTLDEFLLQKNKNFGCGVFGRVSTGLFNQMYGGVDLELLWYPVNRCWAVGLDGAYLRKRKVTGIGFDSRVRKLEGTTPTYIRFPLYQYFADFYYNWYEARLDFKVSAGRFLAGDYGARFELSRNYESGLRLMIWYTGTNAHDRINGRIYHDMGLGFTMPLDMFYTCSSRKEWGNAISAWLRDCGVRIQAGERLYPSIKEARRF